MISVCVLNDTIYCRFSGLPRKEEFNQLLKSFKQEFADCKWDWNRQAWTLPMMDASRLNWFAHRYFGTDAIVYDATLFTAD